MQSLIHVGLVPLASITLILLQLLIPGLFFILLMREGLLLVFEVLLGCLFLTEQGADRFEPLLCEGFVEGLLALEDGQEPASIVVLQLSCAE